jgi:putative ATPase
MRPRSFHDYLGQPQLTAPGSTLRQAVDQGRIPSMILWGPPGVGKTTLAGLVAEATGRPFQQLSAINAGVKDIRDAIEKARSQRFFHTPGPLLFIDEIHRFSKSQQDSLLGAVEKGTVTLIGATTENPSFEVIPALLSRCQVYVLESLGKEALMQLVDKALQEDEWLSSRKVRVAEYEALLLSSGGDARKLLNTLELVAQRSDGTAELELTNALVEQTIQRNLVLYDKTGEQHYDIISAFIKSIRGSDPNAAVYWLARMLEGGEDIEFIARRLIILAAEDIGLANPNALLMATTCLDAIRTVGMPEARIILSQTAIYLATAAKSNSAYRAIEQAMDLVRKTGTLPVPLPLRNAPTGLMKSLQYGQGYQYAHDQEGNFAEMEFLPPDIRGTTLYRPGGNAAEDRIRQWLSDRWKDKYGY